VEEEQENCGKGKNADLQKAEREKAQDLKYKDWLEQHKHRICEEVPGLPDRGQRVRREQP